MQEVIYKMYNPRTGDIFLSLYCNENKYEFIEELDVPPNTDPEDYILELRTEVDLGENCNQRTRY